MERIRELLGAQQSEAPPSQSQGRVPGLMFGHLFPVALATPFWPITDGNFPILPPAGETAQTAIDLTGEVDRRNGLERRRRGR
jgi:hypothetical protein